MGSKGRANPAGIYLFKVNNCVYIINFEQILHIVMVFPLLTLNK